MKKKLLIRNFQSPGDILMLTAAIRDLHKTYPEQYLTNVETSAMELWENNPYIDKTINKDDSDVEIIEAKYDLIHQSNEGCYLAL